MARSLTVRHEEETLSVNWLFTGFMLIAVGWMTLAGIAGVSTAQAEAESADLVAAQDVALQPISRK